MARTPEVLVVDQDLQTRFEIKRLVKQTQLNVVGEAAFGTEGVSLAAEVKPDVIVCGMSRPPERALQTIESLLDNLPETPVIVYSWQQDLETVRQAMLAGVRDFLVMPVDAGQLSRSISAVLEAEEKKRVRSNGQGHLLGARGLVLTVFGAKGGVGKTTLATNLAVALSSQGLSVVLVDADTSFGDVAGMLDLPLQHSIIDLLREVDKLDRDSITDYLMQHQSGLWVSPAPKESLRWRSVSPERVRKTIALLAKRFDMVVVDTGVLLAEVSLTVLEESKLILWVTSTDYSSISNSLQGLETLRNLSYPEEKVRLVLNATSSEDGVRPEKLEQALGQSFFWKVPYDKQLRLAGQMGKPAVLMPVNTRGAQSISQLARSLVGVSSNGRPRLPLLGRLRERRQPSVPVAPLEGRS